MPENIRGWRPPRRYKAIRDAEIDFKEAMRRMTEAIAMVNTIGETLNQTNPGQGDVLYGVAATLMESIEDVGKANTEIKSAMNGEEVKSFRGRKLLQTALRKSPSTKVRQEMRQRRKTQPAK